VPRLAPEAEIIEQARSTIRLGRPVDADVRSEIDYIKVHELCFRCTGQSSLVYSHWSSIDSFLFFIHHHLAKLSQLGTWPSHLL